MAQVNSLKLSVIREEKEPEELPIKTSRTSRRTRRTVSLLTSSSLNDDLIRNGVSRVQT